MVLMADSDGDAVGGIHKFAAEFHFQDLFEHVGHLLLRSIAAAGNGLFYFFRGILYDRDVAGNAAAIATPCARPSLSMDCAFLP